MLRGNLVSSTGLTVLNKVAPDDHQEDAAGNRTRDPCKEGVSPEPPEFIDILSNTLKYAVPVDCGQHYVLRLSQSTTGQDVLCCK